VLAGSPSLAAVPEGVVSSWVQLDSRGAEVRAITSTDRCPDLQVDDKTLPMVLRAASDAQFPVNVCEARLPPGAGRAAVGGVALPLPKTEPRSILIFGDTGCRLKGSLVQDCNDPRAWPFAEVARLAAAHRPDLVIHVGDYYYRESPCPAGRAGCAGSPYGDNWASWRTEFFAPAAPLFAASPWVMARGNHESCNRGGAGWFRLLDAASPAQTCPSSSAPMKIELGRLDLFVLDSADTEDRDAPPQKVADFSAQLDALKDDLSKGTGWLVTHRPIWGLAPVAKLGPVGPVEVALNKTEQEAARGHDLSGVQMIVSGHVHHFASFSFGAARPAQLIAGTGGDIGDEGDSPAMRSHQVEIDGQSAQSLSFERFGYLLMERSGDDWTGSFRDLDDKVIAQCRLHGRSLDCTRTGKTH
jgi:hypothetical protein